MIHLRLPPTYVQHRVQNLSTYEFFKLKLMLYLLVNFEKTENRQRGDLNNKVFSEWKQPGGVSLRSIFHRFQPTLQRNPEAPRTLSNLPKGIQIERSAAPPAMPNLSRGTNIQRVPAGPTNPAWTPPKLPSAISVVKPVGNPVPSNSVTISPNLSSNNSVSVSGLDKLTRFIMMISSTCFFLYKKLQRLIKNKLGQ